MIFAYIILFTALLLSAVAAYYSIAGLTAIFAAAVIPVVIMGATLELGKVIATVWLHNNWKRINWAFKTYLIPAIVFLMLLTSMGIFGFLSKAHSDQSLVSGDAMSKVAIFDEKIATEKENIAQAKKAIEQMNAQVDQMLGRSDTERGAERAVSIRKNQAKERAALQAEITKSQKIIQKLQEERAPLAAEFRKVEAEVGPIKYIAALLYSDNPDQNVLERAVRWVIILIVVVFDPLALCLILAGNKQIEWVREDKEKKLIHEVEEKVAVVPEPNYEPDDGPLTENQIEQVKETAANLDVTPEEEELFNKIATAQSSQPAQDEDTNQDLGECPKCGIKLIHSTGIGPFCPNTECPVGDSVYVYEEMPSDAVELDKTILASSTDNVTSETTEIPNKVPVEEVEQEKIDSITQEANTATKELYRKFNDSGYVEFEGKTMHERVLRNLHPEFFGGLEADESNKGFGSTFPEYAVSGELYIRTDVLPNRVFKFNGSKWIEVSKDNSDSYLNNNKYLSYLVDKISTGEIDPEMLSDAEQETVASFIRNPKA